VFALEILHRRGLEYYEALLPAVIGSLSGYAVYVVTTGLGLDAVWHFPDAGAIHAVDLAWAVGCGVVGAIVAAVFTGGSVVLRKGFRKLPVGLRPVLGGVALAALAFLTPYALTFGEAQISDLSTTTKLLTGGLLLAFVGKLAGTSVTLSSGWRGGFIIPLFFMGLCLGQAAFHLLPGTNEWVLVTCLMAACNVGVTKTPIGTTLVVTEMANQRLLPTILIAAVVSLVLTSGVGLIDSQRRRDGAFGESQPHTAAHLDGDDLANAHPTPVRR
jgi:H+/Cl- antiporter ClcA